MTRLNRFLPCISRLPTKEHGIFSSIPHASATAAHIDTRLSLLEAQMPLLWSFSQLIEYNFRQVASVLFQKYPNEYSTHVVSVDVVDRSVDPETGVVRSERLIGVKQPAPKWVTAVRAAFLHFLLCCVKC